MGCNSSKKPEAQAGGGAASSNDAKAEKTEPPPAADKEEDEKMKAQQGRARRQGVAAERVGQDAIKDYKKPVYPKDEALVAWITQKLKEDAKMKVLFGHMDGEPLKDVVNAFYTKEIPAGTNIIKQGDNGDCLYIIKEGSVDVFVARPGPDGNIAPGDKGPKVVTLPAGALFGELALMYNAPRAATVDAGETKVSAVVLDATDFKMLLAQSSQATYAKYEGWLSEVDLLKSLNHFELSKLADCLNSECFDDGEVIIKQGDPGDKFYILEDGSAAAYITGDAGDKNVKDYLKVGDYFGEIALLNNQPRKATIKATGSGCSVVSCSKEDFDNLLGPVSEILKGQADKYPKYAEFLK